MSGLILSTLAISSLSACVSSGRIAECMWEKEPQAAQEVISASDRHSQVQALMIGYNTCGQNEVLIDLDEAKLIRKLREKAPEASAADKGHL